jgi:alpha-ketoglutarate-dependent taurine dioxygenase
MAMGMLSRHPGNRAALATHDRFLRVQFPDGAHADFHYFWLRHNCDCCRHPHTGERTLCVSDVPLGLTPASAAIGADGETMVIQWDEPGGHRSVYRLHWLREHAYALNRDDVPPPVADVARLEIDAAQLAPAARVSDLCRERVAALGAVVVRRFGTDTEGLIDDLARTGLTVVPTHFGRIEDLRTDNTTNANTDQLGYTDAPVDLHTDQPFLDHPPRYQVLHCMRPADHGGDSVIVDAWQAARHLRSLDAEAFERLTRVPVHFHRRQQHFERLHVSPLIELRGGSLVRIRSSYFTMAPQRLPFAEMESWYRAYTRFAAITNDPRHQYRFRLEAGDFVLYDNFRMLHARTGFVGARWVRGVYFND